MEISGTSRSDAQLLRDYALSGLEAAFSELVHRHTNLVYSAALRQVGSPEAAAEIAQSIFLGLAKGAKALVPRLAEDASMAGWLCRSTRNLALNYRRDEFRRQTRQKRIMEELAAIPTDGPDREQLCRLLDDAMAELSETEYDLLVLRFYKALDYRSVGAAMELTDDAAQKRVSRALEKLRIAFSRRGLRTSTAALAVALGAHSVHAAPAGLALSICSATLASVVTSSSTAIAAAQIIAMTTVQKCLISATLAVLAGVGVYKAREASQLREQVRAVQQQQAPLVQQNRLLLDERNELSRKLAATETAEQPAQGNSNELARLRGEVTRLREASQELARLKAATAAPGADPALEATIKTWAARANQLKSRLEQMPDKRIPELQLLTDKDWFDAVKTAPSLESDTDYRQALQRLRDSAKNAFGELTRGAIKKFAEANNGALPGDMSQLKPFYEQPVDDAILARYSLLQTGQLADVSQDRYLFGERMPAVDDEFDSRYEFNMNGTHSSSVNNPGDVVLDSLAQFALAHQGTLPADAAQLMPYLTRPLDPTKVQEILGSIPQGVTTLDQLKAAGPK